MQESLTTRNAASDELGAIFHYGYFERLETLRDDEGLVPTTVTTTASDRSSTSKRGRCWHVQQGHRRG